MNGMLLGDGVLVKKYEGGGTYFKFTQSEIHLDYLNHVFSLFKELGVVSMDAPNKGHSNIKGTVHTWYQFTTKSLSTWNDLHALWYINGVKVVPKNIFELLTLISLAFVSLTLALVLIFVLTISFSTYLCFYTIDFVDGTSLPAQIEVTFFLLSTLPVVIYSNSDLNKEKIINENRNKSGIYKWTNIITGETYVGSSVNLCKRFKSYFNFNYLSKNKMIISKAILKYGYSNFNLEILEYCDATNVIEREQHYLDLLKPEYNILKTAGSSLGYKHTKETLAKLKARVLTQEQLALAKENLIKGSNSVEQRLAARERMIALNEKKGFKVEVTDQRTNTTTTYPSLRKAANFLGTDLKAIKYNQKVQKERGKIILFKKYYIVKILQEKG